MNALQLIEEDNEVMITMDNLKIIEVDYGIANRFGNEIEVNKHLKENEKLYDSVMKHEIQHSGDGFSLKDLKHDFIPNEVPTSELFKFMLRHPKAFLQFVPIYKTKNRGWVFDANLCLIYGISLLILSGFIYIIGGLI